MTTATDALGLLAPLGIKLTLLLGIVAVLDVAVGRRWLSAAARHLAWTCTMAGALLLPLLGGALPTLPIRVAGAPPATTDASDALPRAHADAPTASPRPASGPARDRIAVPPVVAPASRVASPPTRIPTAPPTMRVRPATLAVIAYLAGVVLVLFRLATEQALVRRLVRRSTPLRDGPWAESLRAVERRAGMPSGVPLLRSAAPVPPLTVGIVRPRVLLPGDADDWSADRREAVLLHELAHVRRRDCLTQTLAALACALYWPHPLAWWAAARLRLERELACDDAVIARGCNAHDYARHLLEIARSLGARRAIPALAVSMAMPTQLEERIRAALDDRRRRAVPDVRAAVAAVGVMLAVVAPLSAAAPSSRPRPAFVAPRSAVVASPLAAATVDARERATSRTDEQPAESARQPTLRGGTFRVRLTTEQEGPYAPGLVHLALNSPGLNTFYTPLDRFDGLAAHELRSRDATLRFSLRRDAGTLTFVGAMQGATGTGRFEFHPDPTYAAELARRGIGRPDAEQHFVLGLHELPLAFLDELAAEGYATPTLREVIRTALSSVDLEFVRDMDALGYRVGSLGTLVDLSNVGVTPTYIRELAASGVRGLSIDELRRTRVRGSLARRGDEVEPVRPAPAERPRAVPNEGDTPLDGRWTIRPLRGGDAQLDIEWADVNQWRRELPPGALAGLRTNDLFAATPTSTTFRYEADAGTFSFEGTAQGGRAEGRFTFAPDRRFVGTLRELGIRELGEVSNHDLKNLGFYGMSAAWIREFQALGLGPLTKDDLMNLTIREVTPDYVRGMQGAGVPGADSVRTIVELRFLNVPVAYAREMSALGYKGIPAYQLIGLYRGGVTPELVRRLAEVGQRNLTPEQLMELGRQRRR